MLTADTVKYFQTKVKSYFTGVFFLAILSFGAFGLAKSSEAATFTVTSCTTANVQSAVNSASAGDKIYLNCSGGTWASAVTITKGIEIYGNGQDATTLTASGTCLFSVTLASGDLRMHDFGITGTGGGCGGLETQLIRLSGNGSTIWNSFRADHIKITNHNHHAFTIDPWWNIPSHPKALFDNISFSTNQNGARLLKIAGHNSTWRQADLYGTDYAIIIEGSTFTWTGGATGDITDTEHGTRLVVRHNTITNGGIQMHDTASVPASRGNRIAEIYGNTFACTAPNCQDRPAMGLRGGGFIIYNNTITGGYFSAAWPQIWRSSCVNGDCGGTAYLGGLCDATPNRVCNTITYYHCSGGDHAVCSYQGDYACNGKGSCVAACTSNADCPVGTDGTATCLATVDQVDGGSNAYGWPCRDQTGRGMEYGAGGRLQEASPVYWYNNGTNATCASGGACPNVVTFQNGYPNHFQLNRDYCLHDPSTDCGTKAGWTYTPLAYPHPLSGGTPSAFCGDSSCNGTETCSTCAQDCGVCPVAFEPNQTIQAEAGTLSGMSQGTSGADTYVYTNNPNQGSVSFTFNITTSGDYKLEARVNNKADGGENSFFVGLDNESAQGNATHSYNILPLQTGFFWDDVSKWGTGTTAPQFDPMVWNLTQGTHTLTFYGRESNTWLDQIRLVSNSSDTTPPASPSGLTVQ